MAKKTRDCPNCGKPGAMVYEARDIPVEYKGRTVHHPVTTWWCTNCQDGILEPEMLAENERLFVELRSEVDMVLLPEQVASIRTKLGISQREAGRLLGGGPRAFQKYESGQTPVSEPMQNLLLLLEGAPARLEELRKHQRRVGRHIGERLATRIREKKRVLQAETGGRTSTVSAAKPAKSARTARVSQPR